MRLIHWPYLLVQILILFILIFILRVAGLVNPLPYIFGPVFFLVVAAGLRYGFTTDHQRGMRAMRRNDYAGAIADFRKSIAYLEEKPWIDRYRAIVLLSPSRMSYREMGMINLAYSLAQTGQREEMDTLYRQTMREYPENEIARAAVAMLDEQKG